MVDANQIQFQKKHPNGGLTNWHPVSGMFSDLAELAAVFFETDNLKYIHFSYSDNSMISLRKVDS